MADSIITKQELIDAQKDAQTLEEVISGEPGKLVETRLGRKVYTLASVPQINTMTREEIDAAVASRAPQTTTYTKTEVDSALSQKATQSTTYTKTEVDTTFAAYVGGRKAYTTLALAQAAQSSLPANTAIEVTNDGTNNGTYQWNGTTLTKSAYDPLTQAKAQIVNGLNNVTGMFFNEPHYEVSSDGTIYFKPKAFGGTGNAFFIRAANIPNAHISLADVVSQLSVYFGVDKYPVTSPLGISDCFKLSGNDDCIVYDHVTGQLSGISRASITLSSNVTIMIARNYTKIGKCVEAVEILKQFESQKRAKDIADLEILTRVFTLADVTNSRTGGVYTEATPSNLKKTARGQILFDTTTKIMHVPQDIIIRKVDKTGTQYRLTSAVDVDFSAVASTDTSVAIYFDNLTKTFIAKASYEAITYLEKASLVLFCIVRSTGSDSTNFSVTANFNYKIDFAQNGEFINKYTCEITDGQATSAVKHITYLSASKSLVLPKDLILGFDGNIFVLPVDTTINMLPSGSTTASSGQIVYWDLYTNQFAVKQWDSILPMQEKYRLVRICNVRDRNLNSGVAVDPSKITLDLGIKHYVDDRPFNLTFSTITEMRLDDFIKAPNHRGYNSVAPENTLPAYILSKKKGYSYVECDVSFTSDDVPVLLHDDTVDRTSNGTGAISSMTLAQAKELDFGSWKNASYAGTKIPTLEEFLQLCHRLNLHPYLELKTSRALNTTLATNLIDIVKRSGMKGRVSWISFSEYQLNQIKAVDETARLGLVVDTPTTALITTAVGLKTGSNSVFINSNHANTTKALVQEAIAAGIEAEVYSPNTASLIPALADMGITGISTDYLNIREILNNSG